MNDLFKTVTAEQFKSYYARDFYNLYLPVWDADKTYFKGNVIYYTDGNFYTSLTDNNTALPSDTENWQITPHLSIYNYITDDDINRALGQALLNANDSFGADDNEKITIFLHLAAFYLVMDLKNASAGLNSSYAGLTASKSVGSVSESYNFPQWVVNNPLYSIYSQNGYGMKYLSLIIPYLSCTVIFSRGRTTLG